MTGRITSLATARAKYPFPWSYSSDPLGRVIVVDLTGREVPMFDMLDTVVLVTVGVAQGSPPTPPGT